MDLEGEVAIERVKRRATLAVSAKQCAKIYSGKSTALEQTKRQSETRGKRENALEIMADDFSSNPQSAQ
jgi:hypothetical protein